MKSLPAISMLIVLSSTTAHASDTNATDGIGRWLHERALQAAVEDSSTGRLRTATESGTYRVLPLNLLDAPEEVKTQLRIEIERVRSGLVQLPDGVIPTQQALLASLPRTRRSDAELRQRLPSPPSNLQASPLGAAELIGMEPSGALDGIRSSGLTRYYRLDGVGIVEFSEDNFRAAGARIEVIEEAQNVTVNGLPAQLQLSIDGQGRNRVELSWATAEKSHSLIATGEGDVNHSARLIQAIAANVID
ncbi:hypothetical protein [Stenotrophomonas sp.]|uniref:hypothetical protein n=1 Tax=Stenotrophomonas sp. TaxID=69392 RepID=UPI00289FD79F|nr:hypothetical protein [Stenotrophomonas sp.]